MKHLKKLLCLTLCVAFLICATSCGSKKEDNAATSTKTITVTDNLGNKVELPKNIDRIAVCGIYPLPSVLAIFFDSASKIVAMPEQSMIAAKNSLLGTLYPEILKANTSFSEGDDVNTEELMKYDPQVVFYGASTPEIGEKLTKAGFNAVAVSVNKWEYNSIETLNQWIKLLGDIFPENEKTDLVTSSSNEIYELVQKRVKDIKDEDRKKVFFLFNYDESTLMTSGKLFFGQWWADAIGAKNVAEELTKDNSVAVNLEQVYKWNPELILITNFTSAQPKDLYNNTIGNDDWSGVDAVKNKQCYKMPLGMYRSYTPGVDTPITLLWLAKTIYPDLFSDIDITKQTKDYYNEVFGITLTDEQANSIFAPVSAAGKGF